ncbi:MULTISPECIES: lysophospholipid acyltransferase family protein [Arsenicicoccus]|uniref:lysophospholipid acyltransferase family protein n=1 Tax=Arsenicicoccus TaxID=267408 RepID=UPI00258116C3|nr:MULTISPECIES: lysophospholipid acyltransferase family protein [Arsenicicoccus]
MTDRRELDPALASDRLMGATARAVRGVLRLYRLSVLGRASFPASGPVVLVANHSGVLDGPLVAAVAPRTPHFLVKQELYAGRVGRLLLRLGQIPVDRTTGDRQALASARTVLDAGGVVGVFPEGTRGTGEVAAVQQGAAWLVLQTGAQVVPVACVGTRAPGRGAGSLPRPGARMVVAFGEPFSVEAPVGVPGRERLRLATSQIHEHLREHVAAHR